ncbi:MAG: hypothetical protein E7356_01045 [Clostridiales bacterium]|nr:hypothetical protein [Clostridiales bacterium]
MKALKGLLIYVGLVLGIALGIGLIMLCIMYFFPSVRIAGYGLVHYSKTVNGQVIAIDESYELDDVNLTITSENIGINVVPIEGNQIVSDLKLSIFGISSEVVEYQVVKSEVVGEDGKLNVFLTVTEPSGWISTSSSVVNVGVPSGMKWGLTTSTKGGSIVVGSKDVSIKLSSLAVSTGKGDFLLVNAGETITTADGQSNNLNLDTMTLSTKTGKFDLGNIGTIAVMDPVELSSQMGEFIFDQLLASTDVTGNDVKLTANKISCTESGFSFIGVNGFINIGSLDCALGSENTLLAENLELNISSLSGKSAIVTTYGDVNIGETQDYTMINDQDGNINVRKASATIVAKTNMGDITVEEYYGTGKFSSNRGNIRVFSRSEYNKDFYTEISNVDGDVKIKNQVNRLIVNTTNRSDVLVIFGKIKTDLPENEVFQHKINVSKTEGSCIVRIPETGTGFAPFKYIATGVISSNLFKAGEHYFPNDGTDNVNAAARSVSFEFLGKMNITTHRIEDLASGSYWE